MTLPLLTRRSVFRGSVLAGVAAVVGFAAARASAAAKAKGEYAAANGYGATTGSSGSVLTPLSAVPVGGGVVVAAADVVVTQPKPGEVHAFSATCTHQGCTVEGVRNGVIACPCHGSTFDPSTGAVLHGPATRPLPPVAVTVSGSSVVRS